MENPLDAPNLGDSSGLQASAMRIAELERQLREERASFASQGAVYYDSSIDIYNADNQLMFHAGPDGTTINNRLYVAEGLLGESALSYQLRQDAVGAYSFWNTHSRVHGGDMTCDRPILVRPPHWATAFIFNARVQASGYDPSYDTVAVGATVKTMAFGCGRVGAPHTAILSYETNLNNLTCSIAGDIVRDANGNAVFGAGISYDGITWAGKKSYDNGYGAKEQVEGTIIWLARPSINWASFAPAGSTSPSDDTLPTFNHDPRAYWYYGAPLNDDKGDPIDWTNPPDSSSGTGDSDGDDDTTTTPGTL